MYRCICSNSGSTSMSQGTFDSLLNSKCASLFGELQSNQSASDVDSFVPVTDWDKLCVAVFNGKVKLPSLNHLSKGKTFDFPQSLSSMSAAEIVASFIAQWCFNSLKYSPTLQRHFHCQTIVCAQLYHLLNDDSLKRLLQWISLNLITGTGSLAGATLCNYQRVFYRSLTSCMRLFKWLREHFEFENMIDQLRQQANDDNSNVDVHDVAKFIINTTHVDDCTIKRWFLFVSSYSKLTFDELNDIDTSLVDKTNIYSLNEKVLKILFPCDDGEEKRDISNTVFGNFKWSLLPVVTVLCDFSKELQKWLKKLQRVFGEEIKNQCINDNDKDSIDIIMTDDEDCANCCETIDSLMDSNKFESVAGKCTLNLFKWLIFTSKVLDAHDEVAEPKLNVDELIILFKHFEKFRSKCKWSNTWTRYGSQYKSVGDCEKLFGFVHGWYYFLAELTHFKPDLSSIAARQNGTAKPLQNSFAFSTLVVSDETVFQAWKKWCEMNAGELGAMALTNIMVYFGEFERKLSASQLICTQLDKQALKDSQIEQFVADSVALQMSPDRSNLQNQKQNYKQHKVAVENINKTGSTKLKMWNVKRKNAMRLLQSFQSKPHYCYSTRDFLGLELILSGASIGEWWNEEKELKKDFDNWRELHSNKYQNCVKNSLGVEALVMHQHSFKKPIGCHNRNHGSKPGAAGDDQQNKHENDNAENNANGENQDDDDDVDCGFGGQVKKCGDWQKIQELKNNGIEIVNSFLGFVLDNVKCNSIVINPNGRFNKVTKYIGQIKQLNKADNVDWKNELKEAFGNSCNNDMIGTLQNMIGQIQIIKNDGDRFIFMSCNLFAIVSELILLPLQSGSQYVNCS